MMSISLKIRCAALLLPVLFSLSICATPLTGFAADINNERPAFTNTAEVTRAEQLAVKRAGQPVPEVIAVIQSEKKAAMAMQAAIQSGNSQTIAAAKDAHQAAEAAADTVMAAFAGVTPADIAAMRSRGMGWAQIAQELGIHPGSLELPHVKGDFPQHKSEMMEATARDVKAGRSMMSGGHFNNFSGSQSMGLDHAGHP